MCFITLIRFNLSVQRTFSFLLCFWGAKTPKFTNAEKCLLKKILSDLVSTLWIIFGGGVLGMPQILEDIFWTFDHLRLFKSTGRNTVFKSQTYFQMPTKWNFTLFCCILQNVSIYVYKFSTAAQNRGGRVQPILAMPVFRSL